MFSCCSPRQPSSVEFSTFSDVSDPTCLPWDNYVDVLKDDPDLDWTTKKLTFGVFGDYDIRVGDVVGSGGYGDVVKATHRPTRDPCAIKVMKREKMKPKRLEREVLMLERVAGGSNVLSLRDVVLSSTSEVMLVFDLKENPPFSEWGPSMTELEVKNYVMCVLCALQHCHKLGVMHRDVKIANILYNPIERCACLIDFGTAGFYQPYPERNKTYPGTRGYKAPEILLHYPYYTYAVDVWSLGCLLLTLLFGRALFGVSKQASNLEQMEAVVDHLGSEAFARYTAKYSKKPFCFSSKRIAEMVPLRCTTRQKSERVNLLELAQEERATLLTEGSARVLNAILVYDHEKRPTITELIAHPYFAAVRRPANKRARAVRAAPVVVPTRFIEAQHLREPPPVEGHFRTVGDTTTYSSQSGDSIIPLISSDS